MSLPDYLLDDDRPEICNEHGVEFPCRYCMEDIKDVDADEKISEGRY